MTSSPVDAVGPSGPVGRSVGEIRADLATCDQLAIVPWPEAARRLLGDVPSLLAEVEAAHRFELAAGVEREALLAEVERVRGEMRSALLCLRSIGARSGTNIHAWNEAFDVIDAGLAAAADAPQPDVVPTAEVMFRPRARSGPSELARLLFYPPSPEPRRDEMTTSTPSDADRAADAATDAVRQLHQAAIHHAAHYERLYAKTKPLVMALRDVNRAENGDEELEARGRVAELYEQWLTADSGNFGPGT